MATPPLQLSDSSLLSEDINQYLSEHSGELLDFAQSEINELLSAEPVDVSDHLLDVIPLEPVVSDPPLDVIPVEPVVSDHLLNVITVDFVPILETGQELQLAAPGSDYVSISRVNSTLPTTSTTPTTRLVQLSPLTTIAGSADPGRSIQTLITRRSAVTHTTSSTGESSYSNLETPSSSADPPQGTSRQSPSTRLTGGEPRGRLTGGDHRRQPKRTRVDQNYIDLDSNEEEEEDKATRRVRRGRVPQCYSIIHDAHRHPINTPYNTPYLGSSWTKKSSVFEHKLLFDLGKRFTSATFTTIADFMLQCTYCKLAIAECPCPVSNFHTTINLRIRGAKNNTLCTQFGLCGGHNHAY